MHYCTFASQYGSVLYSFSQKLDFFFLFRKKLSNLLFPISRYQFSAFFSFAFTSSLSSFKSFSAFFFGKSCCFLIRLLTLLHSFILLLINAFRATSFALPWACATLGIVGFKAWIRNDKKNYVQYLSPFLCLPYFLRATLNSTALSFEN